MATNEEVMITFFGKDMVGDVTKGIDGNVKSMASNITSSINTMNAGLMNISTTANGFLSGLTGGKTASEVIFGTSSKAETNKVLLNNMTETAAGAEKLYKTVDSVTDKSLTSMQELIPAMNAFKAATGASDDEMNNITSGMANFGAAVLAQTGSTERAQTAMMDLSKGIKGAFAALDQYGISEDALMRTGLWSGKEDDVEGYMAAVTEVIGSTEELMNTNEGLDAQLGKAFSRAGKKIGNEFLPIIKDVKRGFLELDNAMGGNLSAGILVAVQGVDMLSQGFYNLSNIIQGVKNINDAWKTFSGIVNGTAKELDNVTDSAKNATDAMANISEAKVQYAPGSTDVLDATTITEAASHAGGIEITDVDMDEIIKGKKKDNYSDLLKYIEEDNKELEKVQKALSKDKINKKEFETLTDKIKEDKKSLFEAFAETGDIPDIDTRKNTKKSWKDYLDGITKSNEEIDQVVNALKNGDINIKESDGAIKTIKENKTQLAEQLVEACDIPDIDIDAKKSSKSVKAIDDVVDGVDDIGDASKKLKKAEAGMDGLEAVADIVPAGTGAKAAASGAEAATASAGFAGLSAGITSMLVPALTVAAVVAIMIPVVAGLAAEALLFVRAIAEVIKALDFDSLDLSGAIDGLKQIGSAMWELFKAMGAMTLLSGATILYQVSSIFLGLQNPIRVAVDEIKKAVSIINELGSVGNIDESIPGKMQSLGATLQSVSEAFRSMQTVVGDVLWGGLMTLGGLLGSFTDNLLIAKTELTNAFNELNTFNIGSVDEGVANNLKSVAETLKAVSDAFGALSDITWDVSMENLLTLGGKIGSISTSLTTAKDDIVEAANTINGFTGLPTIDESITSSLQNVSKGITSVADTLGALQKINDAEGFDWTDWGKDFTTDVQNAREDIENAAKELKKFENLPEVPDVHEKLNNVGKAAAQATNTLKALNGIPPVESGDITSKIIQARYAISNAAIHLKSLEGIAEVPDLTEKLNNVGKAAATATNTTKALSMLAGMEINAADVNTKVQQARYAISNAAIHLSSLAGIATIPDNLSETLTRVGNATVQVKGIATNLSSFPTVDPAVSQSVANAVTVIKDIITQLNTLAGASLTDVGGLLSSINNAIAQMKATLLAASTGFYASGVSIGQSITNGVGAGLSGLNSAVSGPMNSAMSTMTSIGQSGGNRAGTTTTNAFRSTLKLGTVMTTEMGYVKQAVDNGISAAVTAARNGAEDVVQAFKDGINTGSPGDIAWTMHDEMWYTHDFIVSEGKYLVSAAKQLGQDVVTGFGNPTLKTNFGPLGGGDFNRSVIASIETMNSKAPAATSSPVQIIIQEGAIQLDARNLTTQESKQVVINALEGLDCISNIDIRGM